MMRPVTLKPKIPPENGYYKLRLKSFRNDTYRIPIKNVLSWVMKEAGLHTQNVDNDEKISRFLSQDKCQTNRANLLKFRNQLFSSGFPSNNRYKNGYGNYIETAKEYIQDELLHDELNGKAFVESNTTNFIFWIFIDFALEQIGTIYHRGCNNGVRFTDEAKKVARGSTLPEKAEYEGLMTKVTSENTQTGIDYTLAKEELEAALGPYCSYCERPAWSRDLQIEHVLPKSHFPAHRLEWDNFVLSCPECNGGKGNKVPSRTFGIKQALMNAGEGILANDVEDGKMAIDNDYIVPLGEDNPDLAGYLKVAEAAKSGLLFPHWVYDVRGDAKSRYQEDGVSINDWEGGDFSSFNAYKYQLEFRRVNFSFEPQGDWAVFEDWKYCHMDQIFSEHKRVWWYDGSNNQYYELQVVLVNSISRFRPHCRNMAQRTIDTTSLNTICRENTHKSHDSRIYARTWAWREAFRMLREYEETLRSINIKHGELLNFQKVFDDTQSDIMEVDLDTDEDLYYQLYDESNCYESLKIACKSEITEYEELLEKQLEALVIRVREVGFFSVWVTVAKELLGNEKACELAEMFVYKQVYGGEQHRQFFGTDLDFIFF